MVSLPTNRIQELLELRGMTQADLARLADVSVSALNKVVKGTRSMDQQWMRALAPHLGVTPAELLPIEEQPIVLDDVERQLINLYRSGRALPTRPDPTSYSPNDRKTG